VGVGLAESECPLGLSLSLIEVLPILSVRDQCTNLLHCNAFSKTTLLIVRKDYFEKGEK
jgi:hypothetical protein